jgi:hypothetical protein
MQYMFLLYGSEADAPPTPTTPEGFDAYMAPWAAYSKMLVDEGVMRGGDALQDSHTATTVTTSGGKPVFTDGPFAETKEQLGGYYLVECKDLDHAMAMPAQCPILTYGRVEIRPVMDLG